MLHKGRGERMFSIELNSKKDVRNVSLDGDEKVVIEGSLGTLQSVHFLEDLVLEVVGSSGVLRLDLGPADISSPKKNGTTDEGGMEQ